MPSPSVSAVERFLPRTGLVAEIWSEPALDLVHGHPLPCRIVVDLVLAEPADGEVAREWMREVDAADRRGRRHGVGLRQRGAGGGFRPEQVEELPLLGVVRAGRIAECGPDAAEALRDELLPGQLLARLVPFAAHELVQVLGECLG